MDQQRVQDAASDAAAKAGEMAGDAARQAGAGAQSAVERGKAAVEQVQTSATTVARQASEAGRQALSQAGEAMQGLTGERAGQVASNLYQQSVAAGGYVSRFVAEQPVAALLLAGAVGYGLAYLIHRP
jgi:ElaB/YqjD/DUF883 family membrane-anchored ribosome-binding protein